MTARWMRMYDGAAAVNSVHVNIQLKPTPRAFVYLLIMYFIENSEAQL